MTVSLVLATGLIPAWLATKPGEALSLAGTQRSDGRTVSRLRRVDLPAVKVAPSALRSE